MSDSQPTGAGFQVREFRDADVPPVAGLWLRVFRHRPGPPPESLLEYFREVFFRNPWREEDLPSLVCTDPDGRVIGFLGVVPSRMTFRGRPIRAAAATQLMVDPEKGLGYAAIVLLRRFFAGPQDLSFSDGVNDAAARLWQALGGSPAHLLSMEWVRVCRPARHAVGLLNRRLGPLVRAARPLAAALDAILVRLPVGPYHRPRRPQGATEVASPGAILACWQALPKKPALHPAYDPDRFAWLLRMAAGNTSLGELRQLLVRDATGQPIGWLVYYLKPGGVSHLVQLGATEKGASHVLDHLFFDAYTQGSVAVEGVALPRHLRELDDRRCRFRCLSLGVGVHSRDHEILCAIHRGDAFLSRLDGEWWLRFGADRFD